VQVPHGDAVPRCAVPRGGAPTVGVRGGTSESTLGVAPRCIGTVASVDPVAAPPARRTWSLVERSSSVGRAVGGVSMYRRDGLSLPSTNTGHCESEVSDGWRRRRPSRLWWCPVPGACGALGKLGSHCCEAGTGPPARGTCVSAAGRQCRTRAALPPDKGSSSLQLSTEGVEAGGTSASCTSLG